MNLNYKDMLAIAGIVLVCCLIANASYDGFKSWKTKKKPSDPPKA